MTPSFFQSLSCIDFQKQNFFEKNEEIHSKILSVKSEMSQKLAYSFKKKKYVQKYPNLNHELENIYQNINNFQINRSKTEHPEKISDRFSISKEFSYTINPNNRRLKKPIFSNFSSKVGLSLLESRKSSFEAENLRSTQETELCGAESTLDESKREFERITFSKKLSDSEKNKPSTKGVNKSWFGSWSNKIEEEKYNKERTLVKKRSEGSLSKLKLGLKKHTSSIENGNRTIIDRIDEEQEDRELTEYEEKSVTSESSAFYKKNQEPQMIQSIIVIKISDEKRKLDEMEIRSACSIKDESSADEVSEVINGSELTLGKRKFSLAERQFIPFL